MSNTKWASIAAIAASALFVSPAALAESGAKTQPVSKDLKSAHRDHRYDRNARGQTVLRECGSSGYRSNRCYFDVGFDIVDARVHDRKSKGSCDEGDEWGLNGNMMWIRDGCRAIFELSSVRYYDSRNDRHRDGRYGHDRHDRDGRYGHDRRHDYPHDYSRRVSYSDQRVAIGACARAANREVYRYDAYSAQYSRQPRVEIGRKGRLRVTGTVRVHGQNGFRNRQTVCTVGRDGRIDRFRFDR